MLYSKHLAILVSMSLLILHCVTMVIDRESLQGNLEEMTLTDTYRKFRTWLRQIYPVGLDEEQWREILDEDKQIDYSFSNNLPLPSHSDAMATSPHEEYHHEEVVQAGFVE